MNGCEHYETLVSTWLDEGLDRAEQIECLDHVAHCEACRRFYCDARALDGLVALVRTPAGAKRPSPDVWKRVEWLTRKDRRRSVRRFAPVRALQAAAAVVITVGLSVLVWNGIGVAPTPEDAEILLGSSDDMTERRFVELTKEVLQAAPRYHSEMFRIMEQVVRDTSGTREASPGDPARRSDVTEPTEDVEAAGRAPA
jgi:hypothetical protein